MNPIYATADGQEIKIGMRLYSDLGGTCETKFINERGVFANDGPYPINCQFWYADRSNANEKHKESFGMNIPGFKEDEELYHLPNINDAFEHWHDVILGESRLKPDSLWTTKKSFYRQQGFLAGMEYMLKKVISESCFSCKEAIEVREPLLSHSGCTAHKFLDMLKELHQNRFFAAK